MKLDKNHLDEFENISPPMRNALTIPVEIDKPLAGVHIYVCGSQFNPRASRRDVLEVARALRVLDAETHEALCFAIRHIDARSRQAQLHIDLLRRLAADK